MASVPRVPPLHSSVPPLPPLTSAHPDDFSAFTFRSFSTWPKWAIALAVGVPITAVAGYLLYNRNKPNKLSNGSRKSPPRKAYPKSTGDTPSKVGSEYNFQEEKTRILGEPKSTAEKINALKNRGNDLFRAKKYAEAKKFYGEAVDLATQNDVKEDLAQSLQNRAACNEQLKLWDQVIEDCTRALALDSKYAKAYARRSRGYEKQGNLLKALYDLVASTILTNFDNAEYRERSEKMLGQLASKLAKEELAKRPLGYRHSNLSRVFLRQFNQGFTRDPLHYMLSKGPTSYPEGSVGQAFTALCDGKYDKVIEYCTDALTNSETESPTMARLLRGTMLFIMGSTKEARTDLDQVVRMSSSSMAEKTNARIKLACILLHEQVGPEEILAKLDEALKFDPRNPDIFFHRAQVHMLFGQLEQCQEDFRKCDEFQTSGDKSAAFHIAHIEYRLHASQNPMDQARALQNLEEKINKDIRTPDGYVLLAQLFMEMQDFQRAQEYLEKALTKNNDPHDAVVYTQLAFVECLARENREAGKEFAQKALKADENYSPALEMMMDIELQASNLAEAHALYEKCLRLAKNEAEMIPVIQAYQIGEAAQVVHQQLGLTPVPLPFGGGSGSLA